MNNRLGMVKLNNEGSLMSIIEYNNAKDMIIEFQDEYKFQKRTAWKEFNLGTIKNPYFPSVFNIGKIGAKYPTKVNGIKLKEYSIWHGILQRCFDQKTKDKHPTYKNVTCCNEWLLYENFYEWLHSQENFDKWLNGERWAVDKDILVKGNKIYSPDTCCLVPLSVNALVCEKINVSKNLPVGVKKIKKRYIAVCENPFTKNRITTKGYDTPNEAYLQYKKIKERIVKEVAKQELNSHNITLNCYYALIKYEVPKNLLEEE